MIPPPDAFGLPSQYKEWRLHQGQSITDALDAEARFVAQACPTGFGKSLAYVTIACLRGPRAVFLTSTKGLQTQLMNDFGSMDIADIRGRNSYLCRMESDGTRCDHGPCIAGIKCKLKDKGGCDYFNALDWAKVAPLVITNYAYWMTANDLGDGLGSGIKTLVCDEAHDSDEWVSNYLTIVLDRKDRTIKQMIPQGDLSSTSLIEWKEWAKYHVARLGPDIDALKEKVKWGANRGVRRQLADLLSLEKKLNNISQMDMTWVWEDEGRFVSFAPVWPAPHCERYLFRGIPHIHLTSATIRPKTLELLGVENGDASYMEYPHSFPVDHRLMTHVPTVRMNYRTTPAELGYWLKRIDSIIRARQDRKGVLHTVSYKRRDMVISHSQYVHQMITHKRSDTIEMVKRFKDLPPPATLVSPSMATGWDFPYSDCEYQIIGKIPYPTTTNKIVKARTKEDPEYSSYIAMQQLVQACGRGVRAADDRCEALIIDDNVLWFMKRYSHLAPSWFHEAFVRSKMLPKPPPKI